VKVLWLSCVLACSCGPAAKTNQCAYSGDFNGSTDCFVTDALWTSATNTTFLALKSERGSALVSIGLQFEARPTTETLELEPRAAFFERQQPDAIGCGIWFFSDDALPFDNTRDGSEFATDPTSKCTLRLTEVLLTSEGSATRSFELHGTFNGGIAGGLSSASPTIKHAQLRAGF
jgi:hypothetical protein